MRLEEINTVSGLRTYATNGANAATKTCPDAARAYMKALNMILQIPDSSPHSVSGEQYIGNARNALKGADKLCDATRKTSGSKKQRVKSTGGKKTPEVPVSRGALAFMDKLPGPKWAWFLGAGLVTTAVVFPQQTKDALKKIGL